MEILEKICHTSNFKSANRTEISYLVIHYTGNKGDTAANNAAYFARTEKLSASAHYFVDENEIWCSVAEKDIAWHCGASTYRHAECRNANSIGVEICMWDKNGDLRPKSIEHAAKLVRELMEKYGIPVSNVLRHYDVTGKKCPAPMVDDAALWASFLDGREKKTEEESGEVVRYPRLSDIPERYGLREIIEKLMTAGVLKGDGSDPAGNDDVIDLSYDMVRMFVIHYRAGVYDALLSRQGIV